MAYATTYSELLLQAQVMVESTNDEYVGQLPDIIALAQDQVQKDLDLDIWRVTEDRNMTIASSTIARDDTWLKVYGIFLVNRGRFLEQRTTDYLRMYGAAAGIPKFWATKNDALLHITPTPTAAEPYTIEVSKRLPRLSTDNQSNWITKNVPELLLFQTLIGSEAFLEGSERLADFVTLYKAALSSSLVQIKGQKRKDYKPVRAAAQVADMPGDQE